VTGQLWGTSGTLGILYEISKTTGVGSNGRTIDNGSDYEAVDCDQLSPGVVADLAVTKSVDNATPNELSTINYTIVVTNNGPATASVIQLSDVLPAGVTYVSDTPTQGSYDSFTGNWFVGTLTVSSTATLTIQATVNAGTGGSTITNTASVTFLIQSDPNPANDSDSVDIDPVGPTNPIVNSTRDVVDAAPGNGVCDTGALNTQGAIECTLRAAIEEANALAGADNIDFNIPTTELGYSAAPLSYTIQPGLALPIVTEQVVIDGSTQPDFPGTPIIVIDGVSAGDPVRGLELSGAADGSTIRGLVIINFTDRGIHTAAASSTIAGNWIGLAVDGVTAAGNGAQGLFLGGAADGNTIGGTVALDRNVISGNTQGIHIRGDNNVVIGNYVGTDSSGSVAGVGNTAQGIRINSAANGNTIGGTNAVDANIIADNGNDGIDHRSTGTANTFLRNSIYGNSNIGIDLANDGATNNGANGVTANDADDPDTGANNLLNFPVITSAIETVGTLSVDFDLDVDPAGTYRIEFFTNPSGADGSGNGEGEVYQTTLSVVHGGAGLQSFNHSFAGSAGDIITTTATRCTDGTCTAFLGTSEFGNAFTAVVSSFVVNSTRDVADLVAGDGVCDTGALNTAGVTECTLRAAIEEVNAFAGADDIDFDIPITELGHSPAPLSYTIQLGSALPFLTEQVDLDASTQPDFPGTPIIVIDGTSVGAGQHGLQPDLGSDGSTIRGFVINNFNGRGMHVVSSSNTIAGNWIGLNVDGVTAAANTRHNISISAGADNNTIGGALVTDRNVISASGEAGMIIQGDNNDIIGNFIGTDSAGAVAGLGNTFTGIRIESTADNNTIGGITVSSRNTIADNGFDGIRHNGSGVANSFLGNSIHANTLRGIDLGGDGVTANDADDPDSGANNLLNFPVITSAIETSGTLNVDFDLDVPAGSYRIEFFTNPSGADGTGNGEGETYQSTVTIVHGGTGAESFSHSFAGSVGDILTTTATEEFGGPTFGATSEFSAAFTATGLTIVKRAFWPNGTAIPSGVDIPSGVEFKYLLYINNTGAGITDVSVRDVLDPAFAYQTPSIQVDNSVLACALATCDPGEEAAIFTAVDGATVLTDATGDDVVSYGALTVDAGDENVANAQLDIGGNLVWAILFSVTMP